MGPHDLPRCEKTGPLTNSILLSDGTGALCPVGRQIGRVHAPSEVGVAVWPPGRSAKTSCPDLYDRSVDGAKACPRKKETFSSSCERSNRGVDAGAFPAIALGLVMVSCRPGVYNDRMY